ncbi:hypothetical protein FrEUN1fDRAFT_5211 [Parafrankia sp. EUN1f]|nr:hypothetical protein FrEUN1fDRAFT_5211 [Parafrankia sp. EUN1f]
MVFGKFDASELSLLTVQKSGNGYREVPDRYSGDGWKRVTGPGRPDPVEMWKCGR